MIARIANHLSLGSALFLFSTDVESRVPNLDVVTTSDALVPA
jgi:hypothetical protein